MGSIGIPYTSTSTSTAMKRWRIQLAILLITLSAGWYLGYTTEIVAPIHEVGHWLIGGPQAEIISWNETIGLEYNPDQVVQGFRFQVLVLLGLSLIVGGVPNLLGGWYGLGGLPYGLAVGSFFYAFESVDFNDFPHILFEGRGINVYQFIADTKNAWSVAMGLTLSVFAVFILIRWVWVGKRRAA
jgi:hypothetical protein